MVPGAVARLPERGPACSACSGPPSPQGSGGGAGRPRHGRAWGGPRHVLPAAGHPHGERPASGGREEYAKAAIEYQNAAQADPQAAEATSDGECLIAKRSPTRVAAQGRLGQAAA